ncbi:type VI secretion system baseplate subunit TssG [Oceaniglobus roseus]|uniref:type VI secretion system baseplate subunit TssG n=1 Tax=Oceaniglobus roseus TaxID=1737570 RepID=UPI000C7EC196|nr:type VI secretion system baseplate subunit TssG [Kandeliimicrobium roseum]
MAAGPGPGSHPLSHLEGLSRDPGRYHIFLALRILEAQHSDAPRLGESRRPREDRVRLGQEATMAFAPTTVHRYRGATDGRPATLTNLFFGLFGPHGPLPAHLTEYARDRQRNHRDPTFIAFADMLTHRLLSLLYRAWTTGQPAPGLDRGPNDTMERKVAALAGVAGRNMRDRDAAPDVARRHFAGHLARRAKNAAGLGAMVSAFFRVPVTIEQFIGSWLELEPDDRWRLGARAGLGQATSIGDRVWSRSSKFRIRIGPMGMEEYTGLLPGGAALPRLRALVRSYVGDALDWDVNLVLREEEVPAARLGADTRLGQTSWIGTRGGGDAGDLYLSPAAAMDMARGTVPQDAGRGVMR